MSFSGFAFTSKPKKALASTSASGFAAADDAGADRARLEAVTEMNDGKVDGKEEAVKIIPAMKNTFNLGGAQHLRNALTGTHETSSDAEGDAQTASVPEAGGAVEDGVAGEVDAAAIEPAPMDEDAQAAQAMLAEMRAGGSSIFGADDTERYRLDVATRADSTALSGYEAMPIEDFGKAYLRGLGWEEGKPVGTGAGQAVVEPIEYVPRPQLLGLGAAPKKDEKKEEDEKRRKRFLKPGESREPKKDMVYVDEHGRQRHVKKVGDKLVEREKVGFVKGALLAITAGQHKGLYGRVLSAGGMDSDLQVVLKLTMNGEQVTVPAGSCEPVRDAQLERAQPGFTHRQAEQQQQQQQQQEQPVAASRQGDDSAEEAADDGAMVLEEGGHRGGGRAPSEESESDARSDDGRKEHRRKHHKHHKRDREHKSDREHREHKSDREHKEHREHKERKRDREHRSGDKSERAERGSERGEHREHKRSRPAHEERSSGSGTHGGSSGGGGGSNGGSNGGGFWVRESIRVRVVDKRLERGLLYNKKGIVVDVSGVDDFALRLDDDGKLYEHLRHAQVETALPKRGGQVLVLAGPHKLRRGTLLERHAEEARAIVQLSGDLSVVKCSFDDVAEWCGLLGEGLDVGDEA